MSDKARFIKAKALRLNGGITKTQVYQQSGVSAATLRKVEAGEYIRADRVIAILKALEHYLDVDLAVSDYVEFRNES